ncbi:hypothetical protein ACSHT2_07260 [Bradyrhizobium sp. PUT101]|uniref:hypothetical protein n=1 Tax=Bradyrhizobium sp. PUT101 TaxID=3447427 RepID=UPI003F878AEC
MDYLSDFEFSRLPRAYREESRIAEETRFTTELLLTVGAMVAPANLRPIYASRAYAEEVLGSVWEESESSAFFAMDCQEIRRVIKILTKVDPHRETSGFAPAGAPSVAIHVVHGAYPILRGHIELIETVPLTSVEHDPLAMKLIIGLDDRNKLARDNHQKGWHYHYCNSKGQRSDTMLSFDTEAAKANVPLFWERHGEGKAKFRAKAHLWGDQKRESIWTSASPELTKHPLHEFRRPKNEASPVWPLDATLSARARA